MGKIPPCKYMKIHHIFKFYSILYYDFYAINYLTTPLLRDV